MKKTSYLYRDTIVDNAYGVLGVLYLSVYSSCIMLSENSNYLYDCENFPSNIDKYIGFRITKDGTSRLGWLKLNLIGDETVKVHLIETAIQE